jgi:uncharacterized protein
VILLDANLLVYACVTELPQHQSARRWLEERLGATQRVGMPWPSLITFLRLVVNPRVFKRPVPVAAAWARVEGWLGLEQVWVPQPTERHAAVLGPLLVQLGGRAELVPDAHLAALAIEHGLTLCSSDGDFARFSGLRWQNPLAVR